MPFTHLVFGIRKVLRDPYRASQHIVFKVRENLRWDHYYDTLRQPKVKSAVPHDRKIQNEITKELKNSGFDVIDYKIDTNDYRRYLANAEYYKFPNYYEGGKMMSFIEKSLEHYLASKLLNLSKEDIYIDIANANSPAPEIYHKLYDCEVYRQDLIFPEGFHGNVIGGDASNMSIQDGFTTKMALHCSFEHFEGDSDMKFIREANRVLKRGGKLCILPLYLFNKYAIQTNPATLSEGKMLFESDAILYCVKGWRNQHSRFYDVPHLTTRIGGNLNDLRLTIYVVQNEKEIDLSCYIKFIALLAKV